jgi:hypothetical protein
MFRDRLVQKAWEVRRQAEYFPLEVLLQTAVWLEEKYHKTPSQGIAIALALQYFVLAMRQAPTSPIVAKEYFSRAMRWRKESAQAFLTQRQLSGPLNLN